MKAETLVSFQDYRSTNTTRTSHAGETATAQAQCETNPHRRILVVDDDPVIRRLNAERLIQSGYHVDAAKDGAIAWDMLQLNRYDLLVTDNAMPKVSGVELLKKLHAIGMALPVIMATGSLPEVEFTRYPWLQPAATLLKPFTGDELLGTIEKVLRVTDSGTQTARGPASPATPVVSQSSKAVIFTLNNSTRNLKPAIL